MKLLKGLREARHARALSQVELAQLAGMAHSTVVLLERQRRPARPSSVRRLAKVLRTRVAVLYGDAPEGQKVQ